MGELLSGPPDNAFPLHIAGYEGNVDNALKLIPSSDVNQLDNTGRTPLMYASGYAELMPVVEALIAKGANAAAKSRTGNVTAMTYACENGNFAIASYLESKGADANARNNDGETPFEICARVQDEQEERKAKAASRGGRRRKLSRRKTKKIRRRSSRR